MNTKLYLIILLCLFITGQATIYAQSALTLDAYGVWSRGDLEHDPSDPNYNYLKGMSASGSSWDNIQPEDSATYNWDIIQESIDLAFERDQYLYLGTGFGPAAPQWIYEHGVPKVYTTETGHKKHEKWPYYPYYMDEDYKRFYKNFLIEMGEFLKGQPANKLEKIVFIQVKTGCTGDEAAYKGLANDPAYELPKNGKDWSDFRIFAFEIYREVFNSGELNIPLLFNSIEPESFPTEWEWLSSKIGKDYGIKQGALVRGHHLTGERTVVEEWGPHLVNPKELPLFSRSEMDQTWTRPLYQINAELGFYWGVINGLNQGLSVWDISNSALDFARDNESVQNSFRFFNKYADQIYPESSTRAFIALHEGLDASDTQKFPEKIYGPANSNNEERYIAICNDPVYVNRGAKMDDPFSATKGQVYQRSMQKGYNDAGWDIWPGNYSRFITQIDPDNTSIGLFRIDGPINKESPIYSRFARSFENSTGKNTMYFQLDEDFNNVSPQTITFKVTYYDKEKGSAWDFKYDAGKGNFKTAKTITCEGDKTWKTISITVKDAVLNQNGPKECDFALVNNDKKDDIFHMIEVEKQTSIEQ
ncbi:T9SS C-terminal target domain-containing protein [Bacteroidota bacterium]